jgi:nicotinamidase-related amidase
MALNRFYEGYMSLKSFVLGVFLSTFPFSGWASPKFALLVIDVQKSFFQGAVNPDIAGIQGRIAKNFRLASDKNIPFYITYEGSMQGDADIPNDLKPALPRHARQYIKTTFGAMGLKALRNDLEEAGVSHVFLMGAETDVCVMQTALGLRALGVQVYLLKDAVFSSEYNVSPALRRMQMAGVELIESKEIMDVMKNPITSKKRPAILQPFRTSYQNLGLVFIPGKAENGLNRNQVRARYERMREFLMTTAWFDFPLYAPGGKLQLQKDFLSFLNWRQRSALEKIQVRPLYQLKNRPRIRQVLVAGFGKDLGQMAGIFKQREVFFMEDSLLVKNSFQHPFVPMTYKSYYYGMIKSIDPNEWPSQRWVDRDEDYFELLTAPEELSRFIY